MSEASSSDPSSATEQESVTDSVRSELSLDSIREIFTQDRVQRFLIGFLFAAAFFFVEAGAGEVVLSRNTACIEDLSRFRLAPDPNEACLSEFGFHFARALSQGPFGILRLDTPMFIVWPLMAILYGLLGGGFAQLSLRNAVAGYLLLHLLLVMGFMSVDYISQFIV